MTDASTAAPNTNSRNARRQRPDLAEQLQQLKTADAGAGAEAPAEQEPQQQQQRPPRAKKPRPQGDRERQAWEPEPDHIWLGDDGEPPLGGDGVIRSV